MRGMTGIASWDSHLGRGFLLCPHYPPAFWHARRPISRPNDVYTDLPVPNAMRKFHAERLVKGKSTRGQVMCLAQMETKADDQGQKALQAWVRSLYGAPIWPSITSRYSYPQVVSKKPPRPGPAIAPNGAINAIMPMAFPRSCGLTATAISATP